MGWTCGKNGREHLTKRADALRLEDRRRRGRPRLRWEDCVKSFGGSGRGGNERDRGEWRWVVETSDKDEGETNIDDQYQSQPHPGLQG